MKFLCRCFSGRPLCGGPGASAETESADERRDAPGPCGQCTAALESTGTNACYLQTQTLLQMEIRLQSDSKGYSTLHYKEIGRCSLTSSTSLQELQERINTHCSRQSLPGAPICQLVHCDRRKSLCQHIKKNIK